MDGPAPEFERGAFFGGDGENFDERAPLEAFGEEPRARRKSAFDRTTARV